MNEIKNFNELNGWMDAITDTLKKYFELIAGNSKRLTEYEQRTTFGMIRGLAKDYPDMFKDPLIDRVEALEAIVRNIVKVPDDPKPDDALRKACERIKKIAESFSPNGIASCHAKLTDKGFSCLGDALQNICHPLTESALSNRDPGKVEALINAAKKIEKIKCKIDREWTSAPPGKRPAMPSWAYDPNVRKQHCTAIILAAIREAREQWDMESLTPLAQSQQDENDHILACLRRDVQAKDAEIGALERSNQALRGVNTSRKDYNERLRKVLKRIRDYAKEASASNIVSIVNDELPED